MALASMTGFGRAEGALAAWTWSVEARSVNGRNLDVRFRGPNGFEGLEHKVRNLCSARFTRGQIGIAILARRSGASAQAVVNLEALQRYLDLSDQLVSQGRAITPRADGMLALRGVLDMQEPEEPPEFLADLEARILATCDQALADLAQTRKSEGQSLESVLRDIIGGIAKSVKEAGEFAATQPQILKERLAKRLIELLGAQVNEDRIIQEAAILATKADVREELDRLEAHIGNVLRLIEGDAPCGRKLDFYTQEFMREANTLCSKSATSSLTTVGLEMKTHIEQLREQIQNVE